MPLIAVFLKLYCFSGELVALDKSLKARQAAFNCVIGNVLARDIASATSRITHPQPRHACPDSAS